MPRVASIAALARAFVNRTVPSLIAATRRSDATDVSWRWRGVARWQCYAGVLALGVLCACGRETPPDREIARESDPGTVAESAEQPAAESSLAIKRGIMTLTEDRATFTLCGSQSEWWVLDQSPTMSMQTLLEEGRDAPLELYVEGYGERAFEVDEPRARGYEGVFVLEVVLYAGVPGEVRGCDAPEPTYVVTARGNEPFWSVEVHDERMIWRQPEAPTEIAFGSPQTLHAEGAVRYSAKTAEHQ